MLNLEDYNMLNLEDYNKSNAMLYIYRNYSEYRVLHKIENTRTPTPLISLLPRSSYE
jgi:hypothetical protein